MEDLGLGDSQLNVPLSLQPWYGTGWRYAFIPPDSARNTVFSSSPEDWPQPWSDFSRKVPANAHIFVTYYLLGKDLSGEGDPRRRQLWQRLIHLFRQPKGTLAFWPIAIYKNGVYSYCIDEFFETLSSYNPSKILVFGEQLKRILQSEHQDPPSPLKAKVTYHPDVEFFHTLSDSEILTLFEPIFPSMSP